MAIVKEFAYHKPSDKGLETMMEFRRKFSDLLLDIRQNVPSSAELTLMARHLEIANMFLNKAINLSDNEAVPHLEE